jgi:8-oxo-dGTP pyrophosphatase MutT (NUDIX family)
MIPLQSSFEQIPQERRVAGRSVRTGQRPDQLYTDLVRHKGVTRHATAGAFVFCRFPDCRWRLGLIEHPRLDRWMAPGGHVEDDECQALAALREVEEESGLTGVRLLEAPAPALPTGFPSTHARVPLPWWIIQQEVPADSHLPEGHLHVDHQYVAVVDDPEQVRAPDHPFAWYRPHELSELRMFEDTRVLAKFLFSCIGDLAEGLWDGAAMMRPLVATAI